MAVLERPLVPDEGEEYPTQEQVAEALMNAVCELIGVIEALAHGEYMEYEHVVDLITAHTLINKVRHLVETKGI